MRPEFDLWVGKIPWRRERLPTPVFWPGEFHGLYSPWDSKGETQLSDLHFHFQCQQKTQIFWLWRPFSYLLCHAALNKWMHTMMNHLLFLGNKVFPILTSTCFSSLTPCHFPYRSNTPSVQVFHDWNLSPSSPHPNKCHVLLLLPPQEFLIYLFFPTATTQGTSKPDLDSLTRSHPCWAPAPSAHSSHCDLERERNLTPPPSCLKTEWTLLKFRMKKKPVLILQGWAWERQGPVRLVLPAQYPACGPPLSPYARHTAVSSPPSAAFPPTRSILSPLCLFSHLADTFPLFVAQRSPPWPLITHLLAPCTNLYQPSATAESCIWWLPVLDKRPPLSPDPTVPAPTVQYAAALRLTRQYAPVEWPFSW